MRIVSGAEWERIQTELTELRSTLRQLEDTLAQERRISAGRLTAIQDAQDAYLDVDWRWRSAERKIDELIKRIDALSSVRLPTVRTWEN